MSRTDKDVPYRVHVARVGREIHDHRLGFCDWRSGPTEVDPAAWTGPWRYRRTCGLEIDGGYTYTLTLYGRSKLVSWFARQSYDRESVSVRRAARDIIKTHRAGEEIDDVEIPTWQHRHSAAWDAW